MLILLPILILLAAALGLALLGWFRPKFAYPWLVAAGGSGLAWLAVWGLRARLPTAIALPLWRGVPLMEVSPGLLADGVSWPLALALATMCLAVVLTDVGRAGETNWMIWSADLAITALGLLTVMAGNPLTLIVFWVLVDVLELAILLRQVADNETRRRALVFFSTSVLGLMAVVWAMVAAAGTGQPLRFDAIAPGTEVILLIAAGLRMGVLPLQVNFLPDVRQQRGQGTLIRLVPPATSLVLIVRTAQSGFLQEWKGLLLGFAAVAALYGSVGWFRAKDELEGRVFWIVGLAGLSFAAALQSQPAAAMAWGLAMLYTGPALFLASVRERWMALIGVLALFTLSGLPFSPTFLGLGLYSRFDLFSIFLILAQVFLLAGYLRHMLKETGPLAGVERWVRVIYPLGLALLPVTHLLAGGWLGPELGAAAQPPIWPILAAVGLALAVLLARRFANLPPRVIAGVEAISSLQWFYAVLGWVYNAMGRALRLVTLLLEGEGGVLWALVLVSLLISLLTQSQPGGG